MNDKPHFLARKIQDFQRLSAHGFVCPVCGESFQHEPKIWEHAQKAHLDVLGISSAIDQGEIRKKFRNEALERAQHRNPRRVNREVEPVKAKQSSNDNDSTRPNVGDEVGSPAPLRPLSAPGPTTETGKEIDDIKDLQLSQDQGTRTSRSVAQSPVNPLKRGAGAESDSPGTVPETAGHRIASNRRTKALSGGPFVNKDKDPDFRREMSRPNETGNTRNIHGSTKRLFDPKTDSASLVPAVSALRSGKPDPMITPRRFYDTRAHVFRSRKPPPGERGDFQNKIIINSNLNDEEQANEFNKSQTKPARPDGRQVEPPNGTDSMSPYLDSDAEPVPEMLLQPETRSISHDQLVVEVKGIYAGLVMLEAKCIDVDEKQNMEAQEKSPSRQTKLSDEQWQALIILHKTLLHEHHDFFLASQHPSASAALSRLAAKYSMPARMWRHGIHAFLEVLRHRLPESLDHMLAFIYIAYSMMALLYETVPTFEDTWIECLGDLGRYRMAIEDEDPRDRDVWSGVARFWYSKASDKSPNVGRLYHHLAILARPYTLQQLSYYTRSLTCVAPFESAKASIMTLFTPILNGKESAYHRSASFETVFIKAHGILFCGRSSDEFDKCFDQIKDNLLDNYIGRITAKFKEQGVFVAIACIASLFEYGFLGESGSPRSIFRLAFEEVRADQIEKLRTPSQSLNDEAFDVNNPATRPSPVSAFETLTKSDMLSSRLLISQASSLAFICLSIALSRIGDKNILPLTHVYLVFLWSLAAVEKAMKYVVKDVPWSKICSFLNTLAKPRILTPRIQGDIFPKSEEGADRPLPEDFIIRGQLYSQSYFPETWFKDPAIDDEERVLELPSMAELRVERILWLGFRLASFHRWMSFDHDSQSFVVIQLEAEPVEINWPRHSPAPSDLQISKNEDTVMSDINAAGYLSTPGPSVDTPTFIPTKDDDSPKLENGKHDTDVAMKGVDAEIYSDQGPPEKPIKLDTTHWPEISPDMKPAKKITEQVYHSDPCKLEEMRKFDNPAKKNSSKTEKGWGAGY